MLNAKDPILKGAARALYVLSWADKQDRKGKTFPGHDLNDVAPAKTPFRATLCAAQLLTRFEMANGGCLQSLLWRAWAADTVRDTGQVVWEAPPVALYRDTDCYAYDFGWYIAMSCSGHGVSWFDNHEKFTSTKGKDIAFPHCDGLE